MLRTYFQKMAEQKTDAQGAKLPEQTQEDKDKDLIIAELTERVKQLQDSKSTNDEKFITIGKKKYKLKYPSVKDGGVEYDYEALLANKELCQHFIDIEAGVFEEVSK